MRVYAKTQTEGVEGREERFVYYLVELLFLGIYCYCAWILPLYYTTQFDPQAITLAHNKNSHSTLWPLPFLTNVLAPYFIMQQPLLFQHC